MLRKPKEPKAKKSVADALLRDMQRNRAEPSRLGAPYSFEVTLRTLASLAIARWSARPTEVAAT